MLARSICLTALAMLGTAWAVAQEPVPRLPGPPPELGIDLLGPGLARANTLTRPAPQDKANHVPDRIAATSNLLDPGSSRSLASAVPEMRMNLLAVAPVRDESLTRPGPRDKANRVPDQGGVANHLLEPFQGHQDQLLHQR